MRWSENFKDDQPKEWMIWLARFVTFLIGIILISLFFYLQNSSSILQYLDNLSSRNPTAGLKLSTAYGIAKILSLIIGLVIIITTFYQLFYNKREPSNKE